MDNEIHQSLWHACSGIVEMEPLLSSTVYYYPQGHVESYGGSEGVRALCSQFPSTKCRVVSMKYLADPATDEVFAQMVLQPIQLEEILAGPSRTKEPVRFYLISVCVKRLENSDISDDRCSITTENYFTVDDIMNKEDKFVSVRDLHNRIWLFGHSYDNTSSTHYLTTGWSTFVNYKKLHAGDDLVFMKDKEGNITIGIRRSDVSVDMNPGEFFYKIRNVEGVAEGVADQVRRTGNNLCSVEALAQSVGNALKKNTIEAIFYPMHGRSSFFYDAHEVDASFRIPWIIGMSVRKTVVEDYQGQPKRTIMFGWITFIRQDKSSPWKHLKVLWQWKDAYAEEEENCWEIHPCVATAPREPTRKRKIGEMMLFGNKISV